MSQFADWTVLKEMPLIPPSNRNPQQDPMCHFQTRGRHDTSEKLSNLFDSTVMCIMFFSKGLKRYFFFCWNRLQKINIYVIFCMSHLSSGVSVFFVKLFFFTSLPINASWSNLLQHLFLAKKTHLWSSKLELKIHTTFCGFEYLQRNVGQMLWKCEPCPHHCKPKKCVVWNSALGKWQFLHNETSVTRSAPQGTHQCTVLDGNIVAPVLGAAV